MPTVLSSTETTVLQSDGDVICGASYNCNDYTCMPEGRCDATVVMLLWEYNVVGRETESGSRPSGSGISANIEG